MKIQNIQKQKGFTLVEIAIVLVIIGLLLGGVLKGQELIENSKVKSVTADYDNIAAAYYAYRDRTGVYPDDTAQGFWNDLRSEGFITGNASNASAPTHALDGSFSYVTGTGDPSVGTNTGFDKAICASNIDGKVAINIDRKIDDSAAQTGDLQNEAAADYAAGTVVNLCKKL